jgi:hypothetical protein
VQKLSSGKVVDLAPLNKMKAKHMHDLLAGVKL